MASSPSSKVALGLIQYKKPYPRPFNRNITEQLNEYYGLSDFHCKEHEFLSKSLLEISKSYASASSFAVKQKLASEEIQKWEEYIQNRLPFLDQFHQVPDRVKARLHRIWSQMLHRETDSIECKRTLDFHMKFVDHYTFEVPVDKKSLVEMLHPHGGYLSLMPRAFTFVQMMEFYKVQILASYERSLGEDLLARSLSAFNYYRSIQGDHPAGLDKSKANELLKTFKFEAVKNIEEIEKNFEWTLQDFPNEFSGMQGEEFLVRFAVFRKIFLDYNL